jgi:hypothetical protein
MTLLQSHSKKLGVHIYGNLIRLSGAYTPYTKKLYFELSKKFISEYEIYQWIILTAMEKEI